MNYKALLVDLFGTIIPKPDISSHDEFMGSISNKMNIDRMTVEQFWKISYKERLKGIGGSSRGSVGYSLIF